MPAKVVIGGHGGWTPADGYTKVPKGCSIAFYTEFSKAMSGEDAIAYCPTSDYAANVELAEALAPATKRPPPSEPLQKVPTPGQSTCTVSCSASVCGSRKSSRCSRSATTTA